MAIRNTNGMLTREQGGFTLVEIAMAVAILGLGLTTLVGIQSNYTSAFIFERQLNRAALFAEYLMGTYDIAEQAPDTGTEEGSLKSALDKAGYFQQGEDTSSFELENWRYERLVTNVGVPPFDDALRELRLTVSWGEGEKERFILYYYMKSDQGNSQANVNPSLKPPA